MATQNSTDQDEANYEKVKLAQLHIEAAHVINKAKRRLFERSREGTPLGKAAETFQKEVETGLLELIPGSMYADPELGGHESAASESEEKPDTSMVGGYRLLSDVERDYIIESIGNDAAGAFIVGEMILLFEHLAAFELRGEYAVEGEMMDIADKLLAANGDAIQTARNAIRNEAYTAILHYLREQEGGAA